MWDITTRLHLVKIAQNIIKLVKDIKVQIQPIKVQLFVSCLKPQQCFCCKVFQSYGARCRTVPWAIAHRSLFSSMFSSETVEELHAEISEQNSK